MPYSGRNSYRSRVLPGALDLSYTTPYPLGYQREFRISVACPNAPGLSRAPAILFCHGGAQGANYGAIKQTDWGAVLASQGYIVIMITHVQLGQPGVAGSEAAEQAAIIAHLGLTSASSPFKALNYVRHFDIAHVLSQAAAIDAYISTETAGRIGIDASLGYSIAGHSAGSGAALAAAGATRFFEGCIPGSITRRWPFNPAPRCVVAFSVQGIGSDDHLCTGSWSSIPADMPVLCVTGYGDTPGSITQASSRTAAFAEMQGSSNSKYQFWLRENRGGRDPPHGFYNHGQAGFATPYAWMEDTTFAFLDRFVLGDATAGAYLDNAEVVTDSGGMVRFDMK